MKRFTVTDTPYNCGSRRRRVSGLAVGDVFVTDDNARPDRDGDLFGQKEGTADASGYSYVCKDVLEEIVDPPAPTTISLGAFRAAQSALPASASVETVLSVAQAIEKGV